MQQFCTYGSVRGAVRKGRPYRDRIRKNRLLRARLRIGTTRLQMLTEP